jgi:alanyl-tRNA synthetase
MNSKEIRQKYLDFFKARDHVVVPSASLIPENDSSTLFISSGMQPLIPYLLGEKHPEGKRITNSQKSFRTEDMEEVGDNRHNTFFEMLGNWSLGDYFKKEQLPWFFEFLTKEVGVDPKRLYITVYRGNEKIGIPRDSEAMEIWKEVFKGEGIDAKDVDMAERDGLQDGRIFYYPDKKNWWSRSGSPEKMPVGEPGGPDSEVFYDMGEDLKRHENSPWKNEPCHINCDCGRFIEIGNNVFMEYIKTGNGFEKLPQKNVDFGGGLERITMVSQEKTNIFETDLFSNVIDKISRLSGGKEYKDNQKAFEVIADHIKAATFIMGDDRGVCPSNTDQGYIVRRLIRRAIRYGKQLDIKSSEEGGWTKEISKIIIHDYSDVYPELGRNADFVVGQFKDEEEKFARTLEEGLKQFNKYAQAAAGFIETKEDEKELLKKALDSKKIIPREIIFKLYSTYGFPLEMIKEEALKRNVQFGSKQEDEFIEDSNKHQDLSRTASAGKFKGGLADSSEETKKLHTVAHLLLAALRKVLGPEVTQKGSNITAERLRFDFSQKEKMTSEQIAETEKLVNEAIVSDLPVCCEEMPLSEAKEKGAMGVFESKYGERVKVYKVGGDNPFSYEICGGPHVSHTGELGHFRIVKEVSSSAGIRRIKAVLE